MSAAARRSRARPGGRGGARVAETDNVTVVWCGKYKEVAP
jgi:hypothetical protein